MAEIIGEYIDRICSTELRPIGNLPRGVAHRLYDAVRGKGGKPLTFAMATAILDAVGEGDRVVIAAGAGGAPTLPNGEIDGLPGTAVIARALALGRGADVHVLVEERFQGPVRAVLRAAELNVHDGGPHRLADSVVVHTSPVDDEEGEAFSHRILDELEPSLVLAIEKLAPNKNGVIHGSTGIFWHDVHFNPQFIIDEASRRGVLTCGIGDAGNEAGFGSIPEVGEIMPEGAACRCPCGGGMAAAVRTDHLLCAAISDWGGYGLVGVLCYLMRRPDLLADADVVERILRAAVASGVVCGWYARPVLCDDGVPLDAQRAAATLISTAVKQALLEHAHSASH
jgi:hypothetical protein